MRDYVVMQEERAPLRWLGTSSPFNVSAEAASLDLFTRDEVEELLAQHTATTGQRFEPPAVALVHQLSEGQPWLVNALADQVVERDVRDRDALVTAAHVEAAKETIILERRSHIDALVARLREPRVQRVLGPMLAGERLPTDLPSDDVAYVLGLGILRLAGGEYVVANPIYREVLPRALTWDQQHSIHEPTAWYVSADGSLDMPKLMASWQRFWRKDGHLAAEGFGYREAGPHLLLMAFLQRVVNGGGRIEREYGLGRGRLDLIVESGLTDDQVEPPPPEPVLALDSGRRRSRRAGGRPWSRRRRPRLAVSRQALRGEVPVLAPEPLPGRHELGHVERPVGREVPGRRLVDAVLLVHVSARGRTSR